MRRKPNFYVALLLGVVPVFLPLGSSPYQLLEPGPKAAVNSAFVVIFGRLSLVLCAYSASLSEFIGFSPFTHQSHLAKLFPLMLHVESQLLTSAPPQGTICRKGLFSGKIKL